MLRTRIIPAVIVVLITGTALFVFWPEPAARWLRVETSAAVVVDEPFTATVTLLEPAEGAHLHVDLHGRDAHNNPLRCVAAGKAQVVAPGQRTFSFTLVLHDRPDVARVHAIIYLSRSGRWGDAFRVARSEPVKLVRAGPDPSAVTLRPLKVHEQKEDPEIQVANPPSMRAVIAMLWLAAAGVAGVAARRAASGRSPGLFIVLCVAIAVWEGLAAGPWIADQVRAFARAAGLYEERAVVQQWATLATVVVLGGLAAVALRRTRRRVPGLALAGMALYATTSLAGMLSLHEIDRVLSTMLGPWPMAGLLRLTGACVAVAGAGCRLRRR